MKRLLLAGVALLALAGPAFAQNGQRTPSGSQPLPLPTGTPVLRLAEAEQRLVERNLAVIAAQRGVDAARAQRLVSSSRPPPEVSVGNTFGQYTETSRRSVRDARFLSPTTNINAGLTVLIERGGKRELRTRLADENIVVAEAQVLDALRLQLFTLRQAFIAALAARANLEVAFNNRESLDRTEGLLARQVRDGAIPEGDLLRFQASRLPFEAEVTSAAQAYAAAVAQVAVALAADAASFSPAPAQAQRRQTASQPRLVLPPVAFDLRGNFEARPGLGVSQGELRDAVQTRPDVVVAARQFQAAVANTDLAQAGRYRDVTASGGWNRTALSQDQPETARRSFANNELSFNLSIPIFTNQITQGNIGVARGQQGQAEAAARAALLQARADFATAWASYEQSRNLLRIFTEGGALNRAEQAYRSAEQAYLAGGRALVDVLDALRTLNATRVAANNARQSYLTALAQLEAATGVSGIAPRL
ncbi:TolC family protein [Sabulicella glaciei]|uniref:TolC family protein n=1 Tax=Sabulicella glaciei TaxID=2984948 RepID=A0ABT3NUG1_9PROT|nr:TolC family protein [Roseococcus sp. MDT2-1-1]MCW8085799.1 TolC family protein [Roseococcus sp. MDT2-1-1]